jgi:hypothetical protein
MELLMLITLDLFFCILLGFGISLERRLTKLEENKLRNYLREKELLGGITKEIEVLKDQMNSLSAATVQSGQMPEEEQLKALAAEKRFSEGIASILSYDYGMKAQP